MDQYEAIAVDMLEELGADAAPTPPATSTSAQQWVETGTKAFKDIFPAIMSAVQGPQQPQQQAPAPQQAAPQQQAQPKQKAAAQESGIPVWGWAVGGLAVVGIGAGLFFALRKK
jgi:hypothetical protein